MLMFFRPVYRPGRLRPARAPVLLQPGLLRAPVRAGPGRGQRDAGEGKLHRGRVEAEVSGGISHFVEIFGIYFFFLFFSYRYTRAPGLDNARVEFYYRKLHDGDVTEGVIIGRGTQVI